MTAGVLHHRLARPVSAPDVFRLICGERTEAFWLDGGETSYIGLGEPILPREDVLGTLRAELAEPLWPSLGVVGWIGYEVLTETIGPVGRGRPSPYPDAAFLRVDRLVAVHRDGSAELRAAGDRWEGDLELWRRRTVELLETPGHSVAAPMHDPEAGPGAPLPVAWRDTDAEYLAKIADCQRSIAAGDAYVLNLTTEVTVRGSLDAVAVYHALRRESPSDHGALLRIGGVSLLSASPEVFLRVGVDGRVSTSPVKGTRARSEHPTLDARAAAALEADPKERAENTMIVDLMRNDLTRVCRPGSVEVTRLLSVETHPQVHQLVSTVEGILREGLGAVDAVAATFPAGSMTGTPKLSAVAILDRLEDRARGLYAGAFGFFGTDGRAELAMTIRSIVIDGERASIGVGGGITALSVPAEELAETKLKAAALLRALAAT
ncbi:hypothetical protein B7R54_08110 [Subtercola boreus]|uniref:Chorismate-utilising enzyme C-terminal domain-containing protein n=1 Tax=Subtercola boreus TaxID=120213 RepID=A0A3E0VI72_9MICO|nr:anthranilate synthase component I family protein [Subtercola boreus]RFA09193.1 hypothetical protein B7R54_08110 [Subtercola boreus]TQL53787.1 anthranilate synthase component 1 [Subtercola boreus]